MGYTTDEEHEKFISEIDEKEANTTTASDTQTEEEFVIKKKKCKSLHKCSYKGCNKSFWKPSRFQWHLRQHTGERPYKCEFKDCDKAYTTSSHLKRHSRTHNPIHDAIKCPSCKLTLKTRESFRKHYQRVHNNENRISCKECGVVFRKKCKLDDHMAMHNGITSFKCTKCNRIFSSMYLMRKHEKSIHNRVLKCTELNCNEEFFRYIDLRIHRKNAHPQEFHCEQCGKCFRYKSKLKQHIHTHELSNIPCPYDECKKVYSSKSNLQHHIKTKHMGCLFYCDLCGIGVSEKSSLIRHIKCIHEREKPPVKKRPKVGEERLQRKDAGLPRKSMITKLTGIILPHDMEKQILNRTKELELSDLIPVDC
ncbi:hypothetical protein PV327_010738 [Microctonus hyperodae]|uniref:C2H2-type domain-containing protein n=1 Tax=Microctonus hyperodae TaxID=165561 RepID=A0AA39EZ24_MICHY|nr:hypothetical protein PV327_010738 [Microctonus hyperodae]